MDSDYNRVTSRELSFQSGQSSSIMPTSCTELEILNDDVLEDQEAFLVVVTSQMTEVVITSGREEAQVLIDEDANDSTLKEFLFMDTAFTFVFMFIRVFSIPGSKTSSSSAPDKQRSLCCTGKK